jgi:restriction endonuclease S subunit
MKKYPEYKDSEIEWLGKIPKHWTITPFKHIISFINGYAFKSDTYTEDGIPIIRIGDVQKSINFIETKKVPKEYWDELPEMRIYYGDILIALTGATIGKSSTYQYHNPALLNQRVALIRPKSNCVPSFVKYLIQMNIFREYILVECNGGAQGNIGKEEIGNFSFQLPPTQEQLHISTYLDKKTNQIDALIGKKREMIELLKEERAAIINQAVTKGINPDAEMKDSGIEWLGEVPKHWEVKKLKYSLKLITDKNVNGSLLKIGLENIESKTGKYIETDSEFLGEGIKFSKNDLLFGKLRPYLAKVLLSEFEGNAIGDIFVYRAKEQVIPKFAFYRLLSDAFIEVINGSTFGAKMPRASSEFIGELPFPYPSINEQNAIVKYIDERITSIEKTIKITEKEIALIEEYRTALINEAVTGKIKVTESV